jgi:hypothetical protein
VALDVRVGLIRADGLTTKMNNKDLFKDANQRATTHCRHRTQTPPTATAEATTGREGQAIISKAKGEGRENMTELEIFYGQLDDARSRNDDEAATMALRRFVRARSRQIKPRPKMPPFNSPRTHLIQLNNKHLDVIRDYGAADTFDRGEVGAYFITNYRKLFGSIRRSKAKEVPSDEFRRSLLVSQLLNLIELRREENAIGAWPNELPEYR